MKKLNVQATKQVDDTSSIESVRIFFNRAVVNKQKKDSSVVLGSPIKKVDVIFFDRVNGITQFACEPGDDVYEDSFKNMENKLSDAIVDAIELFVPGATVSDLSVVLEVEE